MGRDGTDDNLCRDRAFWEALSASDGGRDGQGPSSWLGAEVLLDQALWVHICVMGVAYFDHSIGVHGAELCI